MYLLFYCSLTLFTKKIKKKYIITGAPGTGKSTLIEALTRQGYSCIQEVSRDVIKTEQHYGNHGTPWQDIERFTQLVYHETCNRLNHQQNSLFSDRSLIDNIAYLKHVHKKPQVALTHFNYTQYYHKTVFFASPWQEIYQQDPQRPQLFEYQIPLSRMLEETYIQYGFTIDYLPFTTVEERVKYILAQLGKTSPALPTQPTGRAIRSRALLNTK